jgi:hypothetical protein
MWVGEGEGVGLRLSAGAGGGPLFLLSSERLASGCALAASATRRAMTTRRLVRCTCFTVWRRKSLSDTCCYLL